MSFDPCVSTRRGFLSRSSFGVGGVALAWMLQQDNLLAKNEFIQPERHDLLPKSTPIRPRAKAMISLFMHGGPSQVDLLDPKPELTKRDGMSYDGSVVFSFFNRATTRLLGTQW